jgi:hypothetical protein
MNRMRAWLRLKLGWIPRPVRRVIIAVIGGTVLLLVPLGILLPILPGWIFLPVALAILAVEFAWAARWLKKIRRTAGNMQQRVKDSGWWWGGPAAEAAKREEAALKDAIGAPSAPASAIRPTHPPTPPNAARAA